MKLTQKEYDLIMNALESYELIINNLLLKKDLSIESINTLRETIKEIKLLTINLKNKCFN